MPLFDRLVVRFLAIAFGFSWAVGGVLALTGGFTLGLRQTVGGFIFMLGPAIAAIVLTLGQPASERRETLPLRVRFDRWLAIAWLVPTLVVVFATLGAGLLPGTHLVAPAAALAAKITELYGAARTTKLEGLPQLPLSIALVLQTFVFGAAFNTPFMLSEELGWRGYLWARWKGIGFWKQSIATGALWGLWHAPLILMGYDFPDVPVAGVGLMVVFCLLLAPLFQLLRQRGGTIWHVCLCHGTLNAGARLGDLCITSEHWYGRGLFGLPGFVLLAAVCVFVAIVKPQASPQT